MANTAAAEHAHENGLTEHSPQAATIRLPPLSSLSLPGSPTSGPSQLPSTPHSPTLPLLQHPRPTYPARTHSQSSPLLDPPTPPPQVSAPPQVVPADVYARAYQLLRERYAGRGNEVREVAEQAKEALAQQQKRRRSSQESADGSEAKRRRSSGAELVLPARESQQQRADVVFFDNPPPLPSSNISSAAATAAQQRRRSAEARLPSLSSIFPPSTLPPLASAAAALPRAHSPRPVDRKRSFSMPPPLPPSARQTSRMADKENGHGTGESRTVSTHPVHFAPLPTSRSLPSLASYAPQHAQHSPSSAPASPALGASSGPRSRIEALSQVVRSFEAVRACRADGWRRLAGSGLLPTQGLAGREEAAEGLVGLGMPMH
ncbi:uncharacterized protein JCM10292_001663 [Rhodotorula paludigena]|uniref:uncharacterized protein n=1 Tax=Rhodotorula paludigena TaxID=86838 RepID=UPI00316B1F36